MASLADLVDVRHVASPPCSRRASDISLKVSPSPEGDTITLTGDIPGITSQSRLEFEAYDFRHGYEQVACQALSGSGGGE